MTAVPHDVARARALVMMGREYERIHFPMAGRGKYVGDVPAEDYDGALDMLIAWIGELMGVTPDSIICPRCGLVSHHPEDKRTGYCGACHWWTSDKVLGVPEALAVAEASGAITPLDGP